MIAGHGIDIIEIPRIQKAMEKSKKFTEKIFTIKEIEYCEAKKNKFQSYAVRFAAKESFLKAIGTGWAKGIAFTDIEILNNESGEPHINLYNVAKEYFEKKAFKNILVSLSHTDSTAFASVIITNLPHPKGGEEGDSSESELMSMVSNK